MKEAAYMDYNFNVLNEKDYNMGCTMYENYGRKDKAIIWESRKGLRLSNGKKQSAATRLEHEFDHYVDDVKNHKLHRERQQVKDSQYDNEEEKRVILGNESDTAIKNGEAIRKNHKGVSYNTVSSITLN